MQKISLSQRQSAPQRNVAQFAATLAERPADERATDGETLLTTQTPADANASDNGVSYELGLAFQGTRPGRITAIRYWRARGDSGKHVGTLWAPGRSVLARVTFKHETASGWQQQDLPTPLPIAAGVTYLVSVNANHYFPDTHDGLAARIVNGDLRSVVGANGAFGPPGSFPTRSYRNSDYFRDIVFVPAAGPTSTATAPVPPTKTATPKPTSTATPKPALPTATATRTAPPTTPPTATATDKPTSTSTPSPIATRTDTPSPSSTATAAPTDTAPPLPIASTTPSPTSSATSTETPTPIPSTATDTSVPTGTSTPTATNTAPPSPTAPPSATATATATDTATATSTPSPIGTDTAVPTDTSTPVLVPASTDTAVPTASPTSTSPAVCAGAATPVATGTAVAGETLFTDQTPTSPNANDNTPYELGVKIQSAKPGRITAIRYYKAASDSGPHCGTVWASDGTILARIAFYGETASGWQQQALNAPLPIQAGTTYVVSVNANGYFADTLGGLATQVANGDLRSVADNNNGVYGAPGVLPTTSYQNSNYFRDIVFAPDATAATATPTPGLTDTPDAASATPTAIGMPTPTATGAPTSTDTPATATDTPAAGGETIFTTQTPADQAASDNGTNYELGLKFRSARAGQITALRYYRAPNDTGTHVGRIWTAGGATLATVSFANETASGWQQQALATPLTIQANTTYVASVNANAYFVSSVGALGSPVSNGDLSTVADGANGVYGSPGAFPTNSYNNSNYFRDVVFVPDPNAATPSPSPAPTAPATTNPIYLENLKQGTTDWQIGNQATTEIAGYAGVTSVNRGDALPLKVSLGDPGSGQYTDAAPGRFTIDVYRLGYYGGAGGRLVASSGALNGITQPACPVTDAATNLVECGWSTSYTLQTGSDWTSGLYIAKLTDAATGKQSEIWFVVRDDSSASAALFQSSVSTFEAYNSYGGYCLYDFCSNGNHHADKVSFDRPYAQTNGNGEFNNMLRWERNMVRWMESQGYDVSYVTNLDVSATPGVLSRHKTFLSVGHDEYWSMEERNAVQGARDAGVNLGFFSANTGYWRVRFESSSAGVPNRVMACYKENWAQDPAAAADPSQATNRFRDPQINRPENALEGVMYVGDRDNLYGGYDFVVQHSTDPYYAHTGLQDGDKLTGLVGFEWDAVVDNGSTPPGLVVLSQSTTDPQTVAPGQTTATASISNAARYTAASGAKVFATGSIQWVWGLDSDGVTSPRADMRAQQVAVNALADLGARPLTPDATLIVPGP